MVTFRIKRAALIVSLLMLTTACQSIGPAALPVDRDRYVAALAQSQTEQILLNIVKLQRGEAPTFVDVTQIVAGYAFQSDLSISGEVGKGAGSITPGGGIHYSDQPTITFTPLTGERYARSLVLPVPHQLVLSLFESGWSAEDVFHLFVRSFNGVRNRQPRQGLFIPADPGFDPTAHLVQGLQEAGALEFRARLSRSPTEETKIVAVLDDRDGRATQLIGRARTEFGVPDSVDEIAIGVGSQRADIGAINLATYSMLQILTGLGNGSELLKIRVSSHQPGDAFTSVPYHGNWYWIDEQDLRSKQTMLALVVMYKLLESDNSNNQPILTIPTR